jgi:hypothetical protein
MKKKKIVTLLLLTIIFFSCKKEEQMPTNTGFFRNVNVGGSCLVFVSERGNETLEIGKLPDNSNVITNKRVTISYKEEPRVSICMMGTSIDIYSIEYL